MDCDFDKKISDLIYDKHIYEPYILSDLYISVIKISEQPKNENVNCGLSDIDPANGGSDVIDWQSR